jgi:hypothetical protein
MTHQQANPFTVLTQDFRHHDAVAELYGPPLLSPRFKDGFLSADDIRLNEMISCWNPLCHSFPF